MFVMRRVEKMVRIEPGSAQRAVADVAQPFGHGLAERGKMCGRPGSLVRGGVDFAGHGPQGGDERGESGDGLGFWRGLGSAQHDPARRQSAVHPAQLSQPANVRGQGQGVAGSRGRGQTGQGAGE